VSILAAHAHPLEFVFGNLLPIGVPTMLLGKRMHFFTFLAIGTTRVIGTSVGHSGYDIEFEWTELFPFRSTTRYHDYHHEGNINANIANSTVLFDWVLGKNAQYYRHL
jgi:sterol desaturase/sphingolipid hydroxylase (fatty acid hydroxylase superfamily)